MKLPLWAGLELDLGSRDNGMDLLIHELFFRWIPPFHHSLLPIFLNKLVTRCDSMKTIQLIRSNLNRGSSLYFNWHILNDLLREYVLDFRAAFSQENKWIRCKNSRYLLNKGANPNLKAHDELDPLMSAVENGDKETVTLLLDKG